MLRKYSLALLAAVATVLLLHAALSQTSSQSPPPAAGTALSPQQLDDLVAPIALYPDPLLGQIMAASTYPLELAEAEQWVKDHSKEKPAKLMDAAKKQSWDPSVQGLVAFPDVLARMAQNIAWATDLGNAFLADQAAVMQAVQRMRAQAETKGTLKTTPQETVANQEKNGQSVITIEPANPDVWYVPNYNPLYVWGPPVWGEYPPWGYPGVGLGIGWFPGIDLGLYFGGWGGWGWGGWGWGPNWFGGGLFIDYSFFHRYGFRHYDLAGGVGRGVWAHDPAHRLGGPYGNRDVAGRFAPHGGLDRFGGPTFQRGGSPQQRVGSPSFEQRGWTGNHSVFGGYHDGGMTRTESDHGFGSMGGGRSFGGFSGGGFHGGGRR